MRGTRVKQLRKNFIRTFGRAPMPAVIELVPVKRKNEKDQIVEAPEHRVTQKSEWRWWKREAA